MKLTGKNYIGNMLSAKGSTVFQAVSPIAAAAISTPNFHEATVTEVGQAIELANRAFLIYSKKTGQEKGIFLRAIADEILALGDTLIKRCCDESGLPVGRITGERGRTMNQLKLFANLVEKGDWVAARIDTAQPDRTPAPKADIRSLLQPLGVVGIFGASNFPLAFSVAGGDTASALAAGCPIVVKAHPSHPGTCELVAQAIQIAIEKTNMPEGVFSMVQGKSTGVGMAIVQHPLTKAIGFTGSFKGGKAIFDTANARLEPIPVYAEMGSTNPVFILPNALKERTAEIASGLTNSVTLGVGQFCTNPGLVFMGASETSTNFQQLTQENFAATQADAMLNQGIKNAYDAGVMDLQKMAGVQLIAKGKAIVEGYKGNPCLLATTGDHFLAQNQLEEEVFGPSTILVTADGKTQLLQIAHQLKGHLTASLFGTAEDLVNHKDLIEILEKKVGRIMINTFPTGVEVCDSMVHGGPFPATTNSRSTSVGTGAIVRFARPVCYQNFPASLLPTALKDENPLGILRLVDGQYTLATSY